MLSVVVFARPQQKICCANPNSCVVWDQCYTPNAVGPDGDGDNDYCQGGVSGNSGYWWDCNTDAQCSGTDVCENNDCVPGCGAEGYVCCSGSCDAGLYCTPENKCCLDGRYWDPDEGTDGLCVDADPCGLGTISGLCVSDISGFSSWYGDLDCYSKSASTGCCSVFRYGEWAYYDTGITTY